MCVSAWLCNSFYPRLSFGWDFGSDCTIDYFDLFYSEMSFNTLKTYFPVY